MGDDTNQENESRNTEQTRSSYASNWDAERRCKNCRHWGDDASQVVSSIGMRFCDGLKQDRVRRADTNDGSWMFVPTAIVPETVWLHDDHVDPRVATGPEFGCVNFEPF